MSTINELIKNIEDCEFECVAGNLKNCEGWIELKNRVNDIDEIFDILKENYNKLDYSQGLELQEIGKMVENMWDSYTDE